MSEILLLLIIVIKKVVKKNKTNLKDKEQEKS
jgi:hypothetical protein